MAEEQEVIENEERDDTAEHEILAAAGFPAALSQQGESEGQDTEEQEEKEEDDPDSGYDFGDGKKFKTQKEALAYSRELIRAQELELAQANAYQQAARDFSPGLPQTQQQTPQKTKEELEAEFYSDPITATRNITQEVRQQILTEQQAAAEDARIQRMFCEENPDLAHLWDLTVLTVQKDPTLFATLARTKGEKAARDLAAQKVRAQIDMAAQIKKPKTELGKGKIVTPAPGQQSVTKKVPAEKPLSMSEQMAKLNEKRRR